jgi:hypothetical protein
MLDLLAVRGERAGHRHHEADLHRVGGERHGRKQCCKGSDGDFRGKLHDIPPC